MEIRLFLSEGAVTLTPDAPQSGVTVTHSVHNDIHTLTLTALEAGIRPEALEVSFPLPASLLAPVESLYFYDDAAHTNDVSGVFTYAENPAREIAQLAVFKNLSSNATFLAGLCTMHRFWSAIFLRDHTVTFRYQNKALAIGAGVSIGCTLLLIGIVAMVYFVRKKDNGKYAKETA